MGRSGRIRKYLLVIFGSMAVLLTGVMLFLASGPGERFIKSRVEQTLSEVIGSKVEIGLLETDLFSRLVLADIRISTESSTDSTFHLNVTGIRVDFDLSRLLRRTIVIRSVRLEGMETALSRREDGTIDIPFPERQEKEGDIPSASSWKVELQEVRIEDSSVRYFDRALNGGMSGSTRIDAAILLRGGATYDFRISGTGGQYSDSLLSAGGVNTYVAGRVDAGMVGEDPPPGIFTVDSLSITSLGLNLTGSGGSVKREAGTDITGDLRLDCDLGELIGSIGGALSAQAGGTTGQLGLEASIGGRIDDPLVEWTLGIPSLRSGDLELRDTWCRGVLTSRSIRVDSLSTKCFGGGLSGSGSVSFDSIGTASVTLSGSGFSLVELHRAIDERDIDYSGSAGMDISINGPATRPMEWKAEISAELYDLVYSGRSTGPLTLGISMENGVFGLDAKQGINTMLAKGDIRKDLLDIGFSLDVREAAPLAVLAGVAGFDGEAVSRGRIFGDMSSPSIEASVKGSNIVYRGIPVESLDVEVRYAEGVFSADNVVFSGTKKGSGSENITDLVPGLTGGFEYRGTFDSYPEDPAGSLEMSFDSLAYRGYMVDEGSLSVALASGRVTMNEFRVSSDSILLYGQGQYSIGTGEGDLGARLFLQKGGDSADAGEIRLGVKGAGTSEMELALDTGNIGLSLVALIARLDSRLAGTADIHVEASGRPDSLVASAEVSLAAPAFGDAGADSLYIKSGYRDGTLILDSLTVWKGVNKASARAVLVAKEDERGLPVFSPESGFSGILRTDGMDLSAAGEFLPEGMATSGLLKLDIEWSGSLRHPVLEGFLQVIDGSLRAGPDTATVRAIDLYAALRDSTVVIRELTGVAADLPFSIKGEVRGNDYPWIGLEIDLSVSDQGTFRCTGGLSADSIECVVYVEDFNLVILEPFIRQVRKLSGRLDGDLALSGRPGNPRIGGHLEGGGLGMLLLGNDLPVSEGYFEIDFEREKVSIDSFKAIVAGGPLSISGEIRLGTGGPEAFDLKCTAGKMYYSRKDIFSVNLESADIGFRTREGYHVLDGEILLGETKVVARFRPQSILPFTRSLEKPPEEIPEFLSKTRLDIRIRESDGIWLDNNLAKLRLGASLNLIGFASSPNAAGRVSVKKGYLIFLDRKLDITRGIVDFIDPDRLNPFIDIEAATEVRSYRGLEAVPYDIRLSVGGKLDEVRVTLTSTPPLDRADIVSLLAIGMTRGQLSGTNDGNGDASVRGVLLQRARQLSAQRMADYVSNKVGAALGLDQLTVEGDLFDTGSDQGATLRATKRINEKAQITYTTGIGYMNDQKVRLEYRFTKRISVQGETDQAGRSGLDLKYRLRYR